MKTIAFINQKGGTGKTTTTLSVGAALARDGYKVLLIDIDPQGNLTTSAGLKELGDNEPTVYEVLKGEASINAAIKHKTGAYDILPTDIRQSGADIELASVPGRELLLKEALEELKTAYDYVLIDCPPSLSIITLMGLTACNGVIIPVQAQYLALQGMAQLVHTIELVKKRMNPQIEIAGVVLTMYDGRKTLDKEILESVSAAFPDKVFKTLISNNVSLAEAPAFGMDIYEYKPDSKGAQLYEELTDEIIERVKA